MSSTQTKAFVATAALAVTALGGLAAFVIDHPEPARREVIRLERVVVVVVRRAEAASQLAGSGAEAAAARPARHRSALS